MRTYCAATNQGLRMSLLPKNIDWFGTLCDLNEIINCLSFFYCHNTANQSMMTYRADILDPVLFAARDVPLFFVDSFSFQFVSYR
jgi:hypothetical protein